MKETNKMVDKYSFHRPASTMTTTEKKMNFENVPVSVDSFSHGRPFRYPKQEKIFSAHAQKEFSPTGIKHIWQHKRSCYPHSYQKSLIAPHIYKKAIT